MSKISRRDLVRGIGLAAVAAPFLSLLERKTARAAPAGHAKYLLIFYSNGTDPSQWTPRGSTATNLVFSPMTEPLAPIKSSLVLVDKLNSNGTADNHGAPGGLCGVGYSASFRESVDQYIVAKLAAAGVTTAIPSLLLGGVRDQAQTSFYKNNQLLSPIYAPSAAYDAIFSGVAPGGSASDLLRQRKSALDVVRGELQGLSRQLGSSERVKLELHLDSIRALEQRLGGGGGGACGAPAAPAEVGQDLLRSAQHLELAVTAFGCDLTRVAAVQFGHHQGTQVAIEEIGAPGDWHSNFIHGENPHTRLIALERWICKQFVATAQKLQATPAPDGIGTLYDQTLMVWARDMGDAITHNASDMRFVFAGGAGGALQTSANGRYLDGGGEAHQRALASCITAMGITDTSGFGDPRISRTPLPGIGA